MAPSKNRIDVSPSEILLDLSASSAPSATLTLTNTSDENMLFKVRTTNPKRYLVKPNQDVFMAGQSVTVTIQLQGREHAEILEKGLGEGEGKDKFMVSCITASDDVLARLKAGKEQGPRELQQVQTDIWGAQTKDDTQNRRLNVNFVLPRAGNPMTPSTQNTSVSNSAANGGSSAAPTSALRPTSSTALSNYSTAGATTTSNNNASTSAPSAAASSSSKPATAATTTTTSAAAPSMASVVAAHIQTPNKKAEEVVDTITSSSSTAAQAKSAAAQSGGGGGDVELSFDTLSKQYKETLATLVQVTEERDRFQQKFKEVSRELQQAREDTRVSSKRLEGSGEGGQLVAKPGYQIWHLVLVALVSFLVAKLMELAQVEVLKSTTQ